MKRLPVLLSGLLLSAALLCAQTVFAAESLTSSLNLSPLTRLYEYKVKLGTRTDASLERRIALERSKIRASIEDQINDLVNALNRTSTGSTSLSDILSQQHELISALQIRSDNANVDLDLLQKEEKEIYQNPTTQTGSAANYRITSSYPELLARRAALEEEIDAFNAYLSIENSRVSRIAWQQRLEQFSILIEIMKYVLLILVVISVERLIRLKLLIKIDHPNARYVVMKIFTVTVYVLSGFWLLSVLSAQYPGVLTSLAIFGAVVAFSIQDVLKDIVGWFVILQRRLYAIGHRITIGPYTGDIIDVGILRTTMFEIGNTSNPDVSRAGQLIVFPNSMVLTNPVMNYHATSDYVEGELTFIITYDSDWRRAQQILEELLSEQVKTAQERARLQNVGRMKHFYISREQQGSRVFLEPRIRGINFTLRYLVQIGQRRIFTSKLTELIFERFGKEPNIRFAVEGGPASNVLP